MVRKRRHKVTVRQARIVRELALAQTDDGWVPARRLAELMDLSDEQMARRNNETRCFFYQMKVAQQVAMLRRKFGPIIEGNRSGAPGSGRRGRAGLGYRLTDHGRRLLWG